MINNKLIVILLSGIFANVLNAALPIYPAEIIARDLEYPLVSWAGHVGVTAAADVDKEADQVIEVLWDDPVIQKNSINHFKKQSLYWGSRYGISDRADHALRILREANLQKDLGCATYTFMASYDKSKGSYDADGIAHPTHCGYFRCDTFINYIFHTGGYNLKTYTSSSESFGKPTYPKLVFESFPKGNGDGPYASQSLTRSTMDAGADNVSVNDLSLVEIQALNLEEFTKSVDIPQSLLEESGVKNILRFAKSNRLSIEKRTLLMDKLGFAGSVSQIPAVIQLYEQLNDNEEAMLKHQIIASTQNLYQRHDLISKHPKEKALLQQFYEKILRQSLSAYDKVIVIRGLINLSSESYVINNLQAINQSIDEQENKISLQSALKLKLALFNKSPQIEPIQIQNILNLLQQENNSELDGILNIHVIDRLSHAGPNGMQQAVKSRIASYLDSVQYQYDVNNKRLIKEEISMFNYGRWLEAKALLESNEFEQASQTIADFIEQQKADVQKVYVLGLSNTNYMKNAFKEKKVLNDFMKKHRSFYLDTVGQD